MKQNYLELSECKECKGCCKRVPTLILDYENLKEIMDRKDADIIIPKLTVLIVKDCDIEKAAKKLYHYPTENENILEYLTISIEGERLFLCLLATRITCHFLGTDGCLLQNKPFHCRIFPYHISEGKLCLAEWCDYHKQFSQCTHEPIVRKITEDYIKTCKNNQIPYSIIVEKMMIDYDFHVVRFNPKSVNLNNN